MRAMVRGPAPLVAWLALGAAFSPVLAGIVRDIPPKGSQAAPLVAAALLALAAGARAPLAGPAPAGSRRGALGCLALGIALELFGLATDAVTVARAGLPFGVLGLAAWLGAPRRDVALLSLWLVPLPVSLLSITSPELESLWGRLAAAPLQAFGLPVEGAGALLRAGDTVLSLGPADGGGATAHLLACLGWYRGLAAGSGWRAAARSALGWALAAPVVQLGAMLLALVVLQSEGREAGLLALRVAPALVLVGLALAWPQPAARR